MNNNHKTPHYYQNHHQRPLNLHPQPLRPPSNHHQPPHQPPSNHHQPPHKPPSNHQSSQNHHYPPHQRPQNHHQPPHKPPSNHHSSQNHHYPPHQKPPNHHQTPQKPPSNHNPPPHQPPPNHHYTPPHNQTPPKPPKSKTTTLASCIVATIFLTFLIIILFILYFTLFKPKDPTISVTAVQLPTFTLSTNSSTVSFTFSLYAAVKNPNRAVFSHFDSSLQLLYSGNQVGFMFIPAGQISSGKTEFMAATFSVQSFPIYTAAAAEGGGNIPAMVGPPVSDGVERVQPAMELEMRLEMVGRVRVLWFFSHHVETLADCRVAVTISDGSVLGFHC